MLWAHNFAVYIDAVYIDALGSQFCIHESLDDLNIHCRVVLHDIQNICQ